MTGYLVTACGAVFLSVIVSFIIPQGKLGKTITFVLRIICIAILISPVTQLFGLSNGDFSADIDYEYICEAYSENQSRSLERGLEEKFGVETECTVEVVYDGQEFSAESVEVCLLQSQEGVAEQIYEYLREADYINITVYEKDSRVA